MSGWNVPYLVGDTVNRDHQYWPIVSPAEFASFSGVPPRLASVTRDTLLAMTWRIKTWKMSGHISATVPASANGSGITNMLVTFDWDIPITGTIAVPLISEFTALPMPVPGPAVKEIDILGDSSLPYVGIPLKDKFYGLRNRGYVVDFSSFGVPADYNISVTVSGPNTAYFLSYTGLSNPFSANMAPPSYISINYSGSFGDAVPPTVYKGSEFVVYDADTSLFYPFVDFKALTLGAGGVNGRGIEIYIDPTGVGTLDISTGIAGMFTLPLKVDGGLNDNFLTRPFPEPGSFGTATITIEPKKFWPYVNTLGQAIYDVDTGLATGFDPFA